MLYLGIGLFFGLLIYKLHNNFRKWRNGYKTVKHSKEWVYVAISEMIVAGIPLIISSEANLFLTIAIVEGMIGFWFWLLFDGIYNLIRKFPFFFTGSEDGKEDAKTDNFLQKLSLWQHVCVKIIPVILFTYLFIIICLKNHYSVLS
jgi:hypothetical protein